MTELRETSESLRRSLEEQSTELEAMRKKVNREVPVNGVADPTKQTSASSSKDAAALKDELKSHKEESKGHKYVVYVAA